MQTERSPRRAIYFWFDEWEKGLRWVRESGRNSLDLRVCVCLLCVFFCFLPSQQQSTPTEEPAAGKSSKIRRREEFFSNQRNCAPRALGQLFYFSILCSLDPGGWCSWIIWQGRERKISGLNHEKRGPWEQVSVGDITKKGSSIKWNHKVQYDLLSSPPRYTRRSYPKQYSKGSMN